MILEDFVMLGTTVPEPNSDGRVFVCSAGFSRELGGLARLYPLARRSVPHRWDIHRVPVQRNSKDSRAESFKINAPRAAEEHEGINHYFEKIGNVKPTDRQQLLNKCSVGSIGEANAKRLSLAVVHPDAIEVHFELNPESPDSPQLALFEDGGAAVRVGARRFAYIPRLKFKDDLGWHDLMLRDWGCYELMRKHDDDYARRNMAGALHLKDSSSLLVGNMNNRRTSWLVISVLNGLREAPTLFEALADQRVPIPDRVRREVYERDGWKCRTCGTPDGLTVDHVWPHSRGGTNALENLQTLCTTCNAAKSDAA